MRSTHRVLAAVAAFSAAVYVSAASFAQEPPPGAPPPPAHEQWAARMHEHAEARAKALHDILDLRPDQDAAFQAFVVSMKSPEGQDGMRRHHDMAEMAGLTTPERLDRMAAKMAEHQAAFARHAAAVKSFYAVLSPEQQRAFDALHGMMGHGHHGHGGPGQFQGSRGAG